MTARIAGSHTITGPHPDLVHMLMGGRMMTVDGIVRRLESLADPVSLAGMARVGITGKKVYGIKIPVLRNLAKMLGRDHDLAGRLWQVESRETRILAAMIGDPAEVTEEMIESWALDFDSWEVCDQCIMCLFENTPFAWKKAFEWSTRKEEFVKRAGFVLMARLAVSDKEAVDDRFEQFFPLMTSEACDSRNMVKKAVNWALRQIGKRNRTLNGQAIEAARNIYTQDSKSAKWIAADALRELESDAVQGRLE